MSSVRHCKRGHPQTAANVVIATDGKRRCRPCAKWRRKRNHAKARVACPVCGGLKTAQAKTCQPCRWRENAVERFLRYVRVEGDCWLWTGGIDAKGYGRWLPPPGGDNRVHRFAYSIWIGPLTPGDDVHHTCRTKHCVRPEHLRSLSHAAHATEHLRTRSPESRAKVWQTRRARRAA